MRSRVEEAIEKIKKNGWAKDLRKCSTLKEKYQKLLELFPEIPAEWVQIARNQLFFYIQALLKVDMGVCEFYVAIDHHQCCTYGGGEIECSCAVPQLSCVIRDKGSGAEELELDS